MKRGDIVLAAVPHADGTIAKNRPALVVQADYYNLRIGNVLVAPITSNLRRRSDAAHFFIDVTTAEGAATGLTANSPVSCLNVTPLRVGLIHEVIGRLSSKAMEQVNRCLKVAFGIHDEQVGQS